MSRDLAGGGRGSGQASQETHKAPLGRASAMPGLQCAASGRRRRREQVLEVQAHQAAGAHLNVVRLFSAWVEDSRIFTQMELCEGSLAGSVPRGKGLDARRTMQVRIAVGHAQIRHGGYRWGRA